MSLEHRSSPLVADISIDDVLECTCLVMAIANEEDLLGSHYSADTNGKSLLGNEVDIVVEETRIGDDCVGGKRFDMGKATQRGTGLVECQVSIRTYTSHKEVDAAGSCNGLFVVGALSIQVLGVAIENMNILGLDIDVAEEVLPHETMI